MQNLTLNLNYSLRRVQGVYTVSYTLRVQVFHWHEKEQSTHVNKQSKRRSNNDVFIASEGERATAVPHCEKSS